MVPVALQVKITVDIIQLENLPMATYLCPLIQSEEHSALSGFFFSSRNLSAKRCHVLRILSFEKIKRIAANAVRLKDKKQDVLLS